MRALAYIRQSDSSGAGIHSLSIESMETELRRWCEAEGWELVGVVREADVKGWMDETKRPGIAEALDRARDRAYDLLLVWSMDRFARSVRIQEDLIFRLAALGVELRSKTEPNLDHAPMIRQILAAVAEEATRTISRHVKRTIHQRMRDGKWMGAVPYGHQKGQDGRLCPDEGESLIVAEIVRRRAVGASFWSIADDLNGRGIGKRGAPWNHRSVRTVALATAHIGGMDAGGEWIDATHPAIVDRATWDACQARATGHRRASRRGAPSTFLAGRAYCGCGLPLYAVRHVSGRRATGERYEGVILRCRTFSRNAVQRAPCDQPKRAISRRKAEAFVRHQLVHDIEHARAWGAALAQAKADQHAAAPNLVGERTRLTAAKTRLERKRSNVIDLAQDDFITKDEARRRLAPIDADLAGIAVRLADTPNPPSPDEFREAGVAITTMRSAIARGDEELIAEAMAALKATVHLEGGALRLRYGSPFGRMLGGG